MNYTLHAGDCLHELKQYPDNYFHSVVTDPPYGLGKEPDALEMLTAWMERGHYEPKARGGFMGRAWDAFVPQPAVWREIYRVMRPGAHLLTFGGTRTYDLLTLALRLAGFEIRDCIYWIYGSGFPKSRDISKAIDAEAGAERTEFTSRPIAYPDSDTWGKPNRNSTPQNFGVNGATAKKNTDGHGNVISSLPATPAAREWDGWGTALKPSAEPIVLARKPIAESTIAANVLAWHAGAINVDAGRIKGTPGDGRYGKGVERADRSPFSSGSGEYQPDIVNASGRWPANVILDEDAAAALDEMSGESKSPAPYTRKTTTKAETGIYGNGKGIPLPSAEGNYGDSGGASRFFYCAKASRRDRDEGLEDFPERIKRIYSGGIPSAVNSEPREMSGGGDRPARNPHPTVKPVALMRYLCRLITPAGGVILDPFAGSGSTGKAAAWEGFAFTGIELDPEHVEIARARIEHAIKQAEAERVSAPIPLPLAA